MNALLYGPSRFDLYTTGLIIIAFRCVREGSPAQDVRKDLSREMGTSVASSRVRSAPDRRGVPARRSSSFQTSYAGLGPLSRSDR